jgi:hypothetical protein
MQRTSAGAVEGDRGVEAGGSGLAEHDGAAGLAADGRPAAGQAIVGAGHRRIADPRRAAPGYVRRRCWGGPTPSRSATAQGLAGHCWSRVPLTRPLRAMRVIGESEDGRVDGIAHGDRGPRIALGDVGELAGAIASRGGQPVNSRRAPRRSGAVTRRAAGASWPSPPHWVFAPPSGRRPSAALVGPRPGTSRRAPARRAAGARNRR